MLKTDKKGKVLLSEKDRWHPLVVSFVQRVLQDGGKIISPAIEEMNQMAWEGKFDDALYVYFAGDRKAGKTYALIPNDGSGDLDVERDSLAWEWEKYRTLDEIVNDMPEMAFDPATRGFSGLGNRNQRTNLISNNNTSLQTGSEIEAVRNDDALGDGINDFILTLSGADVTAINYRIGNTLDLSNTTHRFNSCILKKINTRYVQIWIHHQQSSFPIRVCIDLDTGDYIKDNNNITDVGVRSIGNGYFEVNIIDNFDNSGYPTSSSSFFSVECTDRFTISSSFIISGSFKFALLNRSAGEYDMWTPPIVTEGSTETRESDAIDNIPILIDANEIIEFHNESENTITNLPENYNFKIGTTKYVIQQFNPEKNNYFKVDGETLYIASKWNVGNDLTIRFRKSMANNLMTFNRVAIATGNDITDPDRDIDAIIASASSDYIGPLNISGVWLGGNHLEGGEPTAETISYKFYADGVEVENLDEGFCKEIKVEVINHIFNPSDLTQDFIIEKVVYTVKNNNIEVELEHEFLENCTVSVYYGMQSVGQSFQDEVLFSHGEAFDLQTKEAGANSGENQHFSNVEKIILAKTDKSICQSMWLDKSIGLGGETDENVWEEQSLAFVSGTKTYFRLIQSVGRTAGQKHNWRGVYSWFEQRALISTNILFAFIYNYGEDEILSVDFKDAVTETILLPKRYVGNEIEIVSKDDTVTVNDINIQENGISFTTTGAGNVYLKIK